MKYPSMESGGSSFERAKSKGKKHKGKHGSSDRARRGWTHVEEQVLLDKLLELVKKKWKTDNGFKPGYQLKLERMMRKVLPDTNIRASPHINSKIIVWKQWYGSLQTMLGLNSGIGFNSTTFLLDCDDTQWKTIVNNDPQAANMRYKEWPMYYAWIEIFGNDRATGHSSEDIYQMFNDIQEEDGDCDLEDNEGVESQIGPDDVEGDVGPDVACDMDADTVAPKANITTDGTKQARKRSASSAMINDAMVSVMDRFVSSSDNRLGSLCDVLGYEANLGKARQDIFTMLDCIPELSMDQKIDVSKILAKNPNYLEMFLGFSVDVRAHCVSFAWRRRVSTSNT